MVGCSESMRDGLDPRRLSMAAPESHHEVFDRLVLREVEAAAEECVPIERHAQACGLARCRVTCGADRANTGLISTAEVNRIRVEQRRQYTVEEVTPLGRRPGHGCGLSFVSRM